MIRAQPQRPPSVLLFAWHVVAAATLAIVPTRLVLRESVWSIEARQLPAVFGVSLCYLVGVALFRFVRRGDRLDSILPLATLVIALAPFYLALLLLPGAWYSRWLLLSASAFAAVLVTVPALLPRAGVRLATALLLLVTTGTVGMPDATASPADDGAPVRSRVLLTAYGPVNAVEYRNRMAEPSNGGGITAFDDMYIVATGDGDLYRLGWLDDSDSLRVEPLPIQVPLNRDDFASAVPDDVAPDWFRVAAVLVRRMADSLQLVASHHYWRVQQRCYVTRISTLTLEAAELGRGVDEDRWQTLYDTQPCLTIKRHVRGFPFAGPHIGGRLAALGEGRLLVTSGDYMFDGWNSEAILPQDPSSDYGKMLLIDADGSAERYSSGHRNPQGLHLASDGRIWSTEHGPEGGDELNEIVRGANYGWPYATYGTEYGMSIWPIATDGRAPADSYRDPAFAWVPSIGISSVIEVRRGPLPQWRGDLLVASLDGRTLFRIRHVDGDVRYVEPIPIGSRIRDLIEGDDGRIVLWLDRGGIMILKPQTEPAGAALFARCAGCHPTDPVAPAGIGPNLHGVYGRRIAAVDGYRYSSAFASLSGRWSDETLDALLADPRRFAPGTTMEFEPITDASERALLIEYLASLR